MRSNAEVQGNAASAVLSMARDGKAADGTAVMKDRTAAPDVRLDVGTGVCGDGAAGTGTVEFFTVVGLALLVVFTLWNFWIVFLCRELGNLDLR